MTKHNDRVEVVTEPVAEPAKEVAPTGYNDERFLDVRDWYVRNVIDPITLDTAEPVDSPRRHKDLSAVAAERDSRRAAGHTVKGNWRGSAYIAAKELAKVWAMPIPAAKCIVYHVFRRFASLKPQVYVVNTSPVCAGQTLMKTTEHLNGRATEIACAEYLGLRALVPPLKHRTKTSATASDYGKALMQLDVTA